jgi:hypothetical protein
MFNDGDCLAERISQQQRRYHEWFRPIARSRVVAIELGAGTAIPTVRVECSLLGAALIRINPREPEVRPGDISLPLGALEALTRVDALLTEDDR